MKHHRAYTEEAMTAQKTNCALLLGCLLFVCENTSYAVHIDYLGDCNVCNMEFGGAAWKLLCQSSCKVFLSPLLNKMVFQTATV